MYSYGKFIREFRYTPLVQVVSNVFFWINVGLLGFVYWFLQQHNSVVSSGRGIVAISAGRSSIVDIAAQSVTSLEILPYVWWGMVGMFGIAFIIAMVLHWAGRPGIIPYVLVMVLLLLVLVTKAIVTPILLLGGG
jgi:hypothetical protein